MPKGKIAKVPVLKEYFMAVLNEKHYSIRKLCKECCYACSDRTLRRALNLGQIQDKYLDEIAKFLDVDPRFLSGEIIKIDLKLSRVRAVSLNYYISQMGYYPYSRKTSDDLQKTAIKEHLANLLSLFDFSYNQFDALDFEAKYNFQHELLDAAIPIISKYFKEDMYGNVERPALDTLVFSLENYHEEESQLKHADTTIRKKYIQNPPSGYTPKEIQSMSSEDLLDLDRYLQWQS